MSSEIKRDDIVSLSKDFIRIPSNTGDREALNAALKRTIQELSDFNHQEFVEPQSGTESVIFYNTSELPTNFRVVLNGHIDVVSGNPEQYKPYEKDGMLYGRGASDMKAGLATELLVFKSLANQLEYPIGLQIGTDEETGGFNGTGYQVASGIRSDMVISGESTDLDINNERKGVLVLIATSYGKPGHAAYLERADNATVKIAQLAVRLADKFPIPEEEQWVTTMNIANIQTPNREHNKVPDVASMFLDFRHVPQDSKASLIKIVEDVSIPRTEVKIDRQGYAPYVDPTHKDLVLLAQKVEEELGRKAKFIRKSGSSDSRHFAEKGSAAVDFGPIGYGLHSDNEYGDIESYQQYARILQSFLLSLK